MKNIGRLTLFIICIFFNSLIIQINAQSPKQNSAARQINQKSLTLKLRDLYFKRDFEGGYELGKTTVTKYPDNIELQTWFILNMARTEMSKDAVPAAKQLTEKHKDSGWAWFALANACYRNNKNDESLAAIEKAIAIDPQNEEFILMKGMILRGAGKYEESYAYFDKNSSFIKDKSRVLSINGESLFMQSKLSPTKIDQAKKDQGFADFAEAVKQDPYSVNASFLYGYYLNQDQRFDEAIPVLKKAVSLSPAILEIRQEFWKSIKGQTNITAEQRIKALTTDFEAYLKDNPNSPKILAAVAEQYNSLKNTEKRDFYENQLLEKFPETSFAETIQYNRIYRVENEAIKIADTKKSPETVTKPGNSNTTAEGPAKLTDAAAVFRAKEEQKNKVRQMRWDFINRPTHFDTEKLGNIYYFLLVLSGMDKNVTDEQMSRIIEGSLKYRTDPMTNVNSQIAEVLMIAKAYRLNSIFNDQTEKYARAGVVAAESKISALGKDASPSIIISLRAGARNTLGSILTKLDKFDEAEKELLGVQNMLRDSAQDSDVTYLTSYNNAYLAKLYEAKKDYDKAEVYYLKNADGGPSDTVVFKRLYTERSNGKTDGLAEYLQTVSEKIKQKRIDALMASRIKNPKNAVPFNLKTIDGKSVSYDELKGKIIVMNFWGTWCAPCVGEMPELQQLYKKYENDKDVAIITIDSNDDLETVRKFMSDRKYDFPVLIGDSYTGNIIFNNSIAFPTTLFIGKQGKIEFIKVANSAKLFDEFSWRIEALKQDK